jgi:hypothetical protein
MNTHTSLAQVLWRAAGHWGVLDYYCHAPGSEVLKTDYYC